MLDFGKILRYKKFSQQGGIYSTSIYLEIQLFSTILSRKLFLSLKEKPDIVGQPFARRRRTSQIVLHLFITYSNVP